MTSVRWMTWQLISPRPVFIIQGMADTMIPLDSAQRIYDAAGEPKQLWTELDAVHLGMYSAHPDEYTEKGDWILRSIPGWKMKFEDTLLAQPDHDDSAFACSYIFYPRHLCQQPLGAVTSSPRANHPNWGMACGK